MDCGLIIFVNELLPRTFTLHRKTVRQSVSQVNRDVDEERVVKCYRAGIFTSFLAQTLTSPSDFYCSMYIPTCTEETWEHMYSFCELDNALHDRRKNYLPSSVREFNLVNKSDIYIPFFNITDWHEANIQQYSMYHKIRYRQNVSLSAKYEIGTNFSYILFRVKGIVDDYCTERKSWRVKWYRHELSTTGFFFTFQKACM